MKRAASPGIKDIARIANVSIGTVDRVLHNRAGVSEATRARVLKVIEKTGYRKNVLASRLNLAARQKIQIISLLPSVEEGWGYWGLHRKGIQAALDELKDSGVSLQSYHFDLNDPESFSRAWDAIKSLPFSALITVPFFRDSCEQMLTSAKGENAPVVFLDTYQPFEHPCFYIQQDSYKAGKVAARLLHTMSTSSVPHYLVVNISRHKQAQLNCQQREHGFRAFFEQTPHATPIISTFSHPLTSKHSLQRAFIEALDRAQPEGIFVTSARAFLLADVLKELDISHIHLVGFDLNPKNIVHLQQNLIQFLIHQRPEYQGYMAVKGIYRYLVYKDPDQLSLNIPVEIVVQENLDCYGQAS